MNEYKLIPITLNDYEFIYDVKKNAYKEYVEANWGTWNDEVQRELFKKFIDANSNNIYIIYLGTDKVGFYQGVELDNGDYEIGNICIIPEYQGKGLGTKLLNDILIEHENQNIHLQYFKQNPVGNLYLKLGFVPNGETNYHYQMLKTPKKEKNKLSK